MEDHVLDDDWRALNKMLVWFEDNPQDMSIPYTHILVQMVKISLHLVNRQAELQRRFDALEEVVYRLEGK